MKAILNLMIFLPCLGALACLLAPTGEGAKRTALATAIVTLLLSIVLAMGFDYGESGIQFETAVPWITAINVEYRTGVDGLSLPLVLLTTGLSVLVIAAAWRTQKAVKAYMALYLFLLTGMLGVFLALDLFLFYLFFEISLVPMYFLIGIWGGPRKEYAAIKFFLYTLAGSICLLIVMMGLYFVTPAATGDKNTWVMATDPQVEQPVSLQSPAVRELFSRQKLDFDLFSPPADESGDRAAGFADLLADHNRDEAGLTAAVAERLMALDIDLTDAQHPARMLIEHATERSFDRAGLLDRLDAIAVDDGLDDEQRHTAAAELLVNSSRDGPYWVFAMWAFWLTVIAFLIKLPGVPFHTWLPDAHVEAPTPISMVLAGVLLKMGGYALMRITYPVFPDVAVVMWPIVAGIGVAAIIYGAFCAMAQTDWKKLVAYSSVSHMGYVTLGLAVMTTSGFNGAYYQMIAHGVSSAMMFFLVGVIYDRAHHRDIDRFGGLWLKFPAFGGWSLVGFFAAMGLPGLCGFIGEILVLLGAFDAAASGHVGAEQPLLVYLYAILAASGVILTAGYILWTIQRIYMGPPRPEYDEYEPPVWREYMIMAVLGIAAIVLGIVPMLVFNVTDATFGHILEIFGLGST